MARAPAPARLDAVSSDALVRAALEDELVPGAPAPEAMAGAMRALLRLRAFREARLLARAARRVPRAQGAADALAAMLAIGYGRFEDAAAAVQRMPRALALRLVPAETVAVELAADGATGAATARSLLDGSADLEPDILLDLARHTFARDETELATRALDLIDAHPGPIPAEIAREAGWLRNWIVRTGAADPDPPHEGQVAIGVLDYKLPDYRHTSVNVGDYIQTLASLGHLARHQDVRFEGDPGLASALTALRARVRTERRLAGIDREVALVPVNRDASSLDPIPAGTWVIAFGWYMHSWFRVRHDFPLHPHLRPLFISFHMNRPEAFSDEGIAYLRQRAPIGCRDWTTVRRLLALDVPAFFSGCLTSTVDLLVGSPRPAPDGPVALVEALPLGEPPPGAVELRHADPQVREDGLAANLHRAVEVLESYRGDYSRVVTSRLHCYLPARSIGVRVEFQRPDKDDPRFDGLIGIDDASFAAMRAGIEDKLEVALSAILRGEDESRVRAAWADACAPDVEAARSAVAAGA